MKRIILASQSVQRKLLLKTLGFNFDVMPANIDEQKIIDDELTVRASLVATEKARVIAQKLIDKKEKALIISADTFLEYENQVLEKPENLEAAKKMLEMLSGKLASCLTGFCFIDLYEDRFVAKTAKTIFSMRQLSSSEIEKYVQNNPVTTWSAGFSPAYVEGMALIEKVDGSFTGFSHGLPIEWVVDELHRSDFEI